MNQQLTNFETQTILHSLPILPPSTFPTHPSNPYNQSATIQPIHQITNQSYNPHWIRLQDRIHFGDPEQFLKRFYSRYEQQKKIKLLGQYYRFHLEIPRLFMKEVGSVIEENVEEKRVLEYAIVTREMQTSEKTKKQQKIVNTVRIQPHLKIIKDVQLSYNDFEQKEEGNRGNAQNKRKNNKGKGKQKINEIKLVKKNGTEGSVKRNSSITSNHGAFTYKGFKKQVKGENKVLKKNLGQKQYQTEKKNQRPLQTVKKNENRLTGTKKSEVNLRTNFKTLRTSITNPHPNQKQNQSITRSQSKTLLNTIKPHPSLLASTTASNQQKYQTLKPSASQKQFQHRFHTNISNVGSSKTSSHQNSSLKTSKKKR